MHKCTVVLGFLLLSRCIPVPDAYKFTTNKYLKEHCKGILHEVIYYTNLGTFTDTDVLLKGSTRGYCLTEKGTTSIDVKYRDIQVKYFKKEI